MIYTSRHLLQNQLVCGIYISTDIDPTPALTSHESATQLFSALYSSPAIGPQPLPRIQPSELSPRLPPESLGATVPSQNTNYYFNSTDEHAFSVASVGEINGGIGAEKRDYFTATDNLPRTLGNIGGGVGGFGAGHSSIASAYRKVFIYLIVIYVIFLTPSCIL